MGMGYQIPATQPDGVSLEFNTSGSMTIKKATAKTAATSQGVVGLNGTYADLITITTPSTLRANQKIKLTGFVCVENCTNTISLQLYNATDAAVIGTAITTSGTSSSMTVFVVDDLTVTTAADTKSVKLQARVNGGGGADTISSLFTAELIDN